MRITHILSGSRIRMGKGLAAVLVHLFSVTFLPHVWDSVESASLINIIPILLENR